MKNKSFDFAKLPIKVSQKRTKALFSQMDISENCEGYDKWLKVCRSLCDDEAELFRMLCIKPELCVPIVEENAKNICFECIYAVVGKLVCDNSNVGFAVGRLNVSFAKSDDFEQSGVIYITVKTTEKQGGSANGILDKLVYFKARKQMEYKIKIKLQKELCEMLKAKGTQYVPLSLEETKTYEQVWYEIVAGTKLPKKGATVFFEGNADFLLQSSADTAFENCHKNAVNIFLCRQQICVRVTNASRLKPDDIARFACCIVTAQDFSWVYYNEGDGNSYFYTPDKNKIKE